MNLTDEERQELLQIARNAISAHLGEKDFSVDEGCLQGKLKERCGVFVTLRNNSQLRGCIGYVHSEQPLAVTVAEVAQKAATQDPRFTPVSPEELQDLTIEISVLSPLEKVHDLGEIQIGTHGLYLEGEYHRGLLLPQVAVENKWDIHVFLDQLAKKSGLAEFNPGQEGVTLYKFTAEVFDESGIRHKV